MASSRIEIGGTLIHPEHASVEAFMEYALDNCEDGESPTFQPGDAQKVAEANRLNGVQPSTIQDVIREFRALGITLRTNDPQRRVRGVTDPMHGSNRFAGNAGGSGWSQITGFAGEEG